MCGIVGLLTSDSIERQSLSSSIQKMTDTLYRRGPDDQGIWINEDNNVALGHRRLSILDLSKSAAQPMLSQDKRFCLVFNGEIYNYQEIRSQLKKFGISFKTTSDTEVLIEAIGIWGIKKCLTKLNGMFAFALWDKQEKVLHLARDRNGEKPLYLGYVKNTLLFASELKAFCAYPAFDCKLNSAVISMYLRLSYIPAPHSIYQNIYKLEKASCLSVYFSDNKSQLGNQVEQVLMSKQNTETIKFSKYWDLKDLSNTKKTVDDSLQCVESLLINSIKSRTYSDVPIGALLSGGLDSSTIVALLQTQLGVQVNTFTIGFDDPQFNEAQQAKSIAKLFGSNHCEVIVNEKMALDLIEDLPVVYDEPFADSSQLPTLLISKEAANSVKVVLSGDGGDEVFAGYNRHLWAPLIWRKLEKVPQQLRALANLFGNNPSEWTLAKIDKLVKLINKTQLHDEQGKIKKLLKLLPAKSELDMYLRMISVYDESIQAVAKQYRESQLTKLELGFDNFDYQQCIILNDLNGYLSDDILTKVDRASMYHGLEVRAPFLDHRLIEHMLMISSHKKIRAGQTKWYLRSILAKYIPEGLLNRPKMGFAVPLDKWLRGPLKELCQQLLDPGVIKREGLLEEKQVSKLWKAHVSGRYNHGHKLWNIIMLRLWIESSRVSI